MRVSRTRGSSPSRLILIFLVAATFAVCTFHFGIISLSLQSSLNVAASKSVAMPAPKAAPNLTKSTSKPASGPASKSATLPAPGLRVYLSPRGAVLACAIARACASPERELLVLDVPAALRPHRALLSKCVHRRSRLRFYGAMPSPPPALSAALSRQLPFDLLGRPFTDEFSEHMPHFSSAFLRFASFPGALFLASSAPRALCPSANGSHLAPCAAVDDPPLAPAFAVGRRVLDGPAAPWVRPFLALFLRGARASPRAVRALADSEPTAPLCFRTILTSAREHTAADAVADAPYRRAGISRALQLRPGRKCAPRIVVVSRDPRRVYAGIAGARTVPAPLLRRLVDEIAAQAAAAGFPDVARRVVVVRELGREGFMGQVRVMQQADILLSVHGAELGNLVFLRPGATVLEMFPFGYHMPNFQALMGHFQATHVPVFGGPDADAFQTCVDRELKVWRNVARQKILEIVRQFKTRVELFSRSADDGERDAAADFCTGGWDPAAQLARKCARSQKILIDPGRVAAIIVRHARRMCKR